MTVALNILFTTYGVLSVITFVSLWLTNRRQVKALWWLALVLAALWPAVVALICSRLFRKDATL